MHHNEYWEWLVESPASGFGSLQPSVMGMQPGEGSIHGNVLAGIVEVQRHLHQSYDSVEVVESLQEVEILDYQTEVAAPRVDS